MQLEVGHSARDNVSCGVVSEAMLVHEDEKWRVGSFADSVVKV